VSRSRVRLVGVHGIWNLQPGSPAEAAAVLSARWTAAVGRGLGAEPAKSGGTGRSGELGGAGHEVAVAYYAHVLAREAAQGVEDPGYLSGPEQELLLGWAAALGAPPEVAQGRLTQPARAAADWIARRFGLDQVLVRRLVSVFCREVHAYLDDQERRSAARAVVADTITRTGARVVLAHSLGSVLAYETLWAHPHLQVDLLITLGSPLALPDVVFDRLDPAPTDAMGSRPPGVRRWINIADPGDIIAIPRGLAGFFHGIDADLTTTAGVFNAHKATGYLSCPATAAALATQLGR
jgi:hypothetical protein